MELVTKVFNAKAAVRKFYKSERKRRISIPDEIRKAKITEELKRIKRLK